MRSSRIVLNGISLMAVGVIAFAAGVSVGQEKRADPKVYELRTYTTLPGRLPALHRRFAEHTMKLFGKQGMKNGMYWVPTDEARKDNTLIYFLVHESQEAADKTWKAFVADPEWIMEQAPMGVRDSSKPFSAPYNPCSAG